LISSAWDEGRRMSASAVFDTYARAPLTVESGEGVWLIASDGRRYLDFTSGIATNALGHAHPALVAALKEQADKLWHASNAFRIPGQERLAERLAAISFADKVFFGNSGAEAVECAVKTARRYHYVNGQPERNRIVTFTGSFHGRTLAMLSAAKNPAHTEGFEPLPDGFDQVEFGDLKALMRAIGPETAGILIEPIQGEGGVRVVPGSVMRELRRICDERGLLFIVDEVQTGVGRTGRFFAHEWSSVSPDILAVAKGLGGGFPVGACLATAEAAKGMMVGTHGSTFGGNPLAMAVANAVLDVVLADGFLESVRQTGLYLKQRLAGITDAFPRVVDEVRGDGLLTGLHCVPPNREVLAAMREAGLLGIVAGDNVVRLLPPLIATEGDVDEAVLRLENAFAALSAAAAARA
jgi:acetylornithine/N-succinyldiaminopimelate aminotransferase